jgi:membrane protease subunit HflK
LLSGFYTIQPGERGVVRRFGRVTAIAGPGLHFRLPVVDALDRVAMDQIRQVQTGTALMLTGDTNLIEVALSVHYNVTGAVDYLFNVGQPEQLVAQEARAAIRQAVAERDVDELLTTGRDAILAQTLAQTQALLDEHQAGIRVTNVQLLAVSPPPEVAEAFRDVASAREDKNTYINEAEAYRNEIVPVARGEAEKTLQVAQAEKQRKTDVAVGEADRFVKQLLAYRDAPQITRTRLYVETMERILPTVNKFVLDPSIQTDTTDLWFTNEQKPASSGQ